MRRSRIDSVKAVKKWRETYNTDSGRHTEVKEGISRVEQQISQSMGEIQVLEAKRKQILDGRAMLSAQANWAVRDEEQSRSRVGKLESALADAEGELRDAAAKRVSHEEELRTPMRQELTNEEVERLESLTRESEDQKQALLDVSQARQRVSPRSEDTLLTCVRRLPNGAKLRSNLLRI